MATTTQTKLGTGEPFGLQVAQGEIYKHESLYKYGFHPAASTSDDTIYTYGGTEADYNWPAAATVMEVTSTDANDTSAGTGARTVVVEGLDANYLEVSETVTMNGQTAVVTAQAFFRVHRAYVATAGTGLTNAGLIYVADDSVTHVSGVPSDTGLVHTTIAAGDGQTLQAFYTVPANVTAYLNAVTASVGVASATAWANVSLLKRYVPDGEGFRKQFQHAFGIGAASRIAFEPPLKFTEKTDLQLKADANTGTIAVAASMDLILVRA